MKNAIGKNIKKIREKMDITQDQLAIRLQVAGWQVDRFIISKIERGERQLLDTEIILIASTLKVSIGNLFEKQ